MVVVWISQKRRGADGLQNMPSVGANQDRKHNKSFPSPEKVPSQRHPESTKMWANVSPPTGYRHGKYWYWSIWAISASPTCFNTTWVKWPVPANHSQHVTTTYFCQKSQALYFWAALGSSDQHLRSALLQRNVCINSKIRSKVICRSRAKYSGEVSLKTPNTDPLPHWQIIKLN